MLGLGRDKCRLKSQLLVVLVVFLRKADTKGDTT